MKIELHVDRCVGAGQCTLVAPQVFDQNEEDGTVFLVSSAEPAEELQDDTRQAEFLCPARAIELHE